VLHDQQRHAGVGGNLRQQLGDRLEATRRRTDADERKGSRLDVRRVGSLVHLDRA